MEFKTQIAYSDSDSILLYGQNLCDDILGKVNLGDLAFIAAKGGTLPTPEESTMLNAIMVALSEHGFTPSSVSARLTYLGAPEAVQAAVAAGLLGAGSVYLGSMESTAHLLQHSLQNEQDRPLKDIAIEIVDSYTSNDKRLPGFGHPIHKVKDPRSVKLMEIAKENGFKGKYCDLLMNIHDELIKKREKHIVLNASGVVGCILSDMGFHWKIVKTFSVAARAVGLIGHILEEQVDGISQELWDYMQENTVYHPKG